MPPCHRAELGAVQGAVAASSTASNTQIDDLTKQLEEMEAERDKLKCASPPLHTRAWARRTQYAPAAMVGMWRLHAHMALADVTF